MLVGAHGDDVHAQFLRGPGEFRDQGEHADGAGEAGGVGIDLLRAGGDPVAAGGRIIAEGGDDGLLRLQEAEGRPDLLGSHDTAARGVHAEDDGLHGVVLAEFVDFLDETVGGDAIVAGAVGDLAVGEEDGDILLATEIQDLGGDIVGEGDEVKVLHVIHHGKTAEFVHKSLVVKQFVHQPFAEHILREVEFQAVDEPVDVLHGDAAGLGDLAGNGIPEGIDHYLILLTVLIGGSVLDVHFAGGLVFAVADELIVHAHLVQDVLEEDHPSGEAGHLDHAAVVGGHVDLVAGGGEVIGAVGGVLRIGHDGLAALAELGEGVAEFFQVGRAGGGAVRTEEDILDAGIGRRRVNGLDGIPEAHGGDIGITAEGETAQLVIGRLLGDGDLRHVQVQHAFTGQDGLAAAQGGHAADHHEEQEEADQLHHDERADDGQHHFDKFFHLSANNDITHKYKEKSVYLQSYSSKDHGTETVHPQGDP